MLENGFVKIKLVGEDITRRRWLIRKLMDTVVIVKNIYLLLWNNKPQFWKQDYATSLLNNFGHTIKCLYDTKQEDTRRRIRFGIKFSPLFFSSLLPFTLFPVIAIDNSLLTQHFNQDYPFERITMLLSWYVMLPKINAFADILVKWKKLLAFCLKINENDVEISKQYSHWITSLFLEKNFS